MMFREFFRKKRSLGGMEIEDCIMTVTQKEDAVMETPFERRGLHMAWAVSIFFICILAVRVFYLDMLRGEYYSDVSKENRVRSIPIKGLRGKIIDKSGKILAGSVPSMDAVILPNYLPEDPQRIGSMAGEVSKILNIDGNEVLALLEKQNRKSMDPVLLAENITQDQALILMGKSLDFSGITVENSAVRQYEFSSIFSSVIGYDGKVTKEEMSKNEGYRMNDYIGKAGLEKQYEKDLRGIAGAKRAEVDSKGNIKKDLGTISPKSGNDLVLNIDSDLQKKIYDSMVETLEKDGKKTAAAVAIDPRDGSVLAMVSLPSYDNNLFAKGISSSDYAAIINDKDLPLLNRAINGEYPPGSTIKPAVAAAALSEGVISPETIIDGMGGSISIGGFTFRDWKTHGPSDVRTAIAESNNIFFYSIGGGYGNIQGLGMSRMKKYENLFGFGEPTGIDLPGESSGFIPDEQWKMDKFQEKWYIGNSYHASIGQGYITATPLQLANYTAAIANGGTLYVPRIVSQIKKDGGQTEFLSPRIIRKGFVDGSVLKVVREGMKKTVMAGTAQSLNDLPVEVAGKTGTSQFGSGGETHGWFISFAPYEDPEIAMAIITEGGGDGHSLGIPVTKEVYGYYFGQNDPQEGDTGIQEAAR